MSSACLRGALALLALTLLGCEREERDYDAPPLRYASEHIERDAYDVAQGKQLFQWMNCVGCHGHGGGGMGPALSDSYWRYGGTLGDIYQSIHDGRPNGMPAWRDRLPEQQIWQLAAYVRSMGRYVSKDVAPSRDDALQSGKSENRRPRSAPIRGEPPS